jgi:hypothetical protein
MYAHHEMEADESGGLIGYVRRSPLSRADSFSVYGLERESSAGDIMFLCTVLVDMRARQARIYAWARMPAQPHDELATVELYLAENGVSVKGWKQNTSR